jgi:hypothetical protein
MDANSIYADPQIINNNISSPDFHLQNTSSCIDAGNPSFIPATNETDYFGNARVSNSKVDIGAHEFSSASLSAEIENENSILIYPNPSPDEISVKSYASEIEGIEIYDVFGNTIISKAMHLNEVVIRLNSKGIFFYKIALKNKRAIKGKLIID